MRQNGKRTKVKAGHIQGSCGETVAGDTAGKLRSSQPWKPHTPVLLRFSPWAKMRSKGSLLRNNGGFRRVEVTAGNW